MTSNIHNGGLAMKKDGYLYLADLHHYSGTYIINEESGDSVMTDGVLWFMNENGQSLYYSDQARGNRLFKYDLVSSASIQLVDRPVYGLTLSGDWLYYVNETDRKIYRCLKDGSKESCVTDDPAESFLIDSERIYYTTQQGIRVCGLTGSNRELVSEVTAAHMIKMGSRLVFTDKRNHYSLSVLDLETGETSVHDDITPTSLNSDGRYLYCANRSNDSTIYRLDLESGSKIRICGERADYIHILGNEIYFCSRLEWYRMSLSGGQASKVITAL